MRSRTEGQGLRAVYKNAVSPWRFGKDAAAAGGRPGWGGRKGEPGHEVGRVQLCLPTATGALHKAVVSGDSRAHLVEEIQLFPRPEPVLNLQLAPTQVGRGPGGGGPGPRVLGRHAGAPDTPSPFQGAVFAGFSGGVVKVPRANCSVYESCVDCVLARDPHCAWDPESRICRLLPTPVP